MLMAKPATIDDVISFEPQKSQSEDYWKMREYLCRFWNQWPEHTCVIYYDEKPILLVGLVEIRPRVYDSYTVFSENIRPHHYKRLVSFIKSYISNMDFDRIEHTVRADLALSNKVANLFGFKKEALLKKYANGNDFCIYSIVRF